MHEAPVVCNIVLVHGAFSGAASWRRVYDRLSASGFKVSLVRSPLTSLAADAAAARRVLSVQNGPTILVGHDYGGAVITEVGEDAKAAGLVYIAGFAPDVGQSVHDQYSGRVPPGNFHTAPEPDGFVFVERETYREAFCADLPMAEAAFLRDSQVPAAAAALEAKLSHAAWRVRPSWYMAPTADGALSPDLARSIARRIGARTIEVEASHMVLLSQPDAVADVIVSAATEALAHRPTHVEVGHHRPVRLTLDTDNNGRDLALDEALLESFPASDPPASLKVERASD
jgi:pimeloyl-ACP methyl ester carboxylesterase